MRRPEPRLLTARNPASVSQVSPWNSNINAAYGIPAGVYVASVTPGSGAEAAGIRKGDVITKFDGKTVSTIQELKEKLQYYAAGEAVSITVQSPGEGAFIQKRS